jgi:hypothetical protein
MEGRDAMRARVWRYTSIFLLYNPLYIPLQRKRIQHGAPHELLQVIVGDVSERRERVPAVLVEGGSVRGTARARRRS